MNREPLEKIIREDEVIIQNLQSYTQFIQEFNASALAGTTSKSTSASERDRIEQFLIEERTSNPALYEERVQNLRTIQHNLLASLSHSKQPDDVNGFMDTLKNNLQVFVDDNKHKVQELFLEIVTGNTAKSLSALAKHFFSHQNILIQQVIPLFSEVYSALHAISNITDTSKNTDNYDRLQSIVVLGLSILSSQYAIPAAITFTVLKPVLGTLAKVLGIDHLIKDANKITTEALNNTLNSIKNTLLKNANIQQFLKQSKLMQFIATPFASFFTATKTKHDNNLKADLTTNRPKYNAITYAFARLKKQKRKRKPLMHTAAGHAPEPPITSRKPSNR